MRQTTTTCFESPVFYDIYRTICRRCGQNEMVVLSPNQTDMVSIARQLFCKLTLDLGVADSYAALAVFFDRTEDTIAKGYARISDLIEVDLFIRARYKALLCEAKCYMTYDRSLIA